MTMYVEGTPGARKQSRIWLLPGKRFICLTQD